jgi:hypothetical protein
MAYQRLFPHSKSFKLDAERTLFGGFTHGFLEYTDETSRSGDVKRIVFVVMHPGMFICSTLPKL